MVRQSPDPDVSLYALIAYYLRFLRLKHDMTQDEVGKIIGCTKSQVSKYEGGTRQIDEREADILDQLWDTGGILTILLRYAKLGVDPNWSEKLRRYQRNASVLRIYYNNVIPMPFQTEGYARSLLTAGHDARLVDDVERAVAKRMEHQEAMLADDPAIWAVLDEVALRPMAEAAVMEEQRDLLLKLSLLRHVSIRVIPEKALPYIGVDGGFSCFELPRGLRVAFAGTSLNVGRVIEDQVEAARVAVRFEKIAAQACSEVQSREWISRMRT
ncbi:helix-turn-helix domain-containing protein [Actinomadura montaniterrae]|uniref:Helix-turn-helix transcriptional regulator n=1 Tax=Actinomadura montaniterrae TaxID=1803903 RepID=A0A6L3VWW4_9ACTN|nr:helix-turn-helix transcriptional regulator [Actinomadura montaniterrae]KAB2383633.1 helix-turn-helix transcriptional regulator [Actinomadura montaniterrae]